VTFRAIDMTHWSVDAYEETRAAGVFFDPETSAR
jgi:hypothetical protein